jgi:hypothetical protein
MHCHFSQNASLPTLEVEKGAYYLKEAAWLHSDPILYISFSNSQTDITYLVLFCIPQHYNSFKR